MERIKGAFDRTEADLKKIYLLDTKSMDRGVTRYIPRSSNQILHESRGEYDKALQNQSSGLDMGSKIIVFFLETLDLGEVGD